MSRQLEGPGYCRCSSWGMLEATVLIASSSTLSGTKKVMGPGAWKCVNTWHQCYKGVMSVREGMQ